MYAEQQHKSPMSRTIDRSPRQSQPVQRSISYEGVWNRQGVVENFLNQMPNIEMFRRGDSHLHVFFEHSPESTNAYTQTFINGAEVTVELHLNIRTLQTKNDIETTIFHEWSAHIMSLNTRAQIVCAQRGIEYSEPSEIELLEHTAYAFGGDVISQAIPENSSRALRNAITKDRKMYEIEVEGLLQGNYNVFVAEKMFYDKLFGHPLAYILELDDEMERSIQAFCRKAPLSRGEIEKRISSEEYPDFNDFFSDIIESFNSWESYFKGVDNETGLAIIRYLLTMANKYKKNFEPTTSLESWSNQCRKLQNELIKLLDDDL